MGKSASVELRRELSGPRALVWALTSDTNRLDRALGAGRSAYARLVVRGESSSVVERAGEGPREGSSETSLRVGVGRAGGREARWTEHGEWIEGDYLVAERRFLEGPLERASLRVEVREGSTPGRSAVTLSASMTFATPVASEVTEGLSASMRAALDAYLDAIDELLARRSRLDVSGPAGVVARRLVASAERAPDGLDGPRAPTDEAQLAFCAERFSTAPVAAPVRAALLELVRSRSDAELVQMRPFELAPVLGASPREALAAFLHAARAGLVSLLWELGCPSCRVASASAASLDALRPEAHCADCDITFDAISPRTSRRCSG